MSNYVIKSDLESATGIGTSKFTKKANLANVKSDLYKLDIDNLKILLVDLSKLSNVVKNDVVKKIVSVYDDWLNKLILLRLLMLVI